MNYPHKAEKPRYCRGSREKTGRAIIGTVNRQTERVILGYLALAGERTADEFLFRNRSGFPYSKDTLGDDFRTVRSLVFPGNKRVLMDMRHSGAVEAAAGEVDPNALAAKMGNTIYRSQQLQRTYQPVDLAAVRLADEARRRGHKRIREQDWPRERQPSNQSEHCASVLARVENRNRELLASSLTAVAPRGSPDPTSVLRST